MNAAVVASLDMAVSLAEEQMTTVFDEADLRKFHATQFDAVGRELNHRDTETQRRELKPQMIADERG